MDFNEIREFATKNPVCFLATDDAGLPRVRGMLLWFCDPSGFYFSSGSTKRMVQQVQKNPNAEICFYNPGGGNPINMRMMRLTGKIELVEDETLMKKLYAERPYVLEVIKKVAGSKVVILRMAHADARFWTMADNLMEKELETIKF